MILEGVIKFQDRQFGGGFGGPGDGQGWGPPATQKTTKTIRKATTTKQATTIATTTKPTDLDECSVEMHTCHVEATCTNTGDGLQCKCNSGFEGDGYNCHDINECEGDNPCSGFSDCINYSGGYSCQCKAGFARK